MTAAHNCPLCGAGPHPSLVQAAQEFARIASSLEALRINMGLLRHPVGGQVFARAAAPWVDAVIMMVAAEHGLSPAALLSDNQTKSFSRPRFLLMWVLSQVSDYSLGRIGEIMERDRASVRHGLSRVNQWRRKDDITRQHTDALVRRAQAIRDGSARPQKQGEAA